ncbi:glycosyltransferase family 4 protein [Desulfogranum marinum]|uniref:glycosyltransferase family 4 protein n=1 Tax=Desulfogranum marinum TaxID=453220 RepID=UPI0029C6EFEC|nr:glycosyltransferase family 4 protein [Desulfogranum marinum]
MSPTVLHINCNLIFTSLYYNLFRALSNTGISQTVWVPHKKYHIPSEPEKINRLKYYFTGYQDFFDRALFRRKINKGLHTYTAKESSLAADVIHAHTLFSDGALAYELNAKTGIPYIVTVRNTDVNVFWKYFKHLHGYGQRIAKNASAIIFLSPSYKKRMMKPLFSQHYKEFNSRAHVIPNGLDPYWLSCAPVQKKKSDKKVRVLFVGSFVKNKNIEKLVQACSILDAKGLDVALRLVGAMSESDFAYAKKVNWIETLSFSKQKDELREHYRWADVFVMPSFRESFGLVYAEALSQGTPVVFTRGQGFDGWVTEGICGCGVSPRNANEIASKILLLQRDGDEECCRKEAAKFIWKAIAGNYSAIYIKSIDGS